MRNLLYLISILSIGCAKPYKKVHSKYDPSAKYSAVLVGATVDTRPFLGEEQPAGEDTSTQPTLRDKAAQGELIYKTLPEFGPKVVPIALPYWQKEGFVVFTDKERVTKEVPEKIEGVLNFLTKVSGVWSHPETTQIIIDNNSFLLKGSRKRIVSKYDSEVENEVFVFTYVYFENRDNLAFKTVTRVVFDTVVLNEEGEYLYRSRGIGDGNPKVFMSDVSTENLLFAFDNAILSLNDAEVKVVDK